MNDFQGGYQAALADVATALDERGEEGVREWLANNQQIAADR